MDEKTKRNKKIIRRIFFAFLFPIIVGGIFVVHVFCTDVEMRRSVMLSINRITSQPMNWLYENDREFLGRILECEFVDENVTLNTKSLKEEDLKEMSSPLTDVYKQMTEHLNDTESEGESPNNSGENKDVAEEIGDSGNMAEDVDDEDKERIEKDGF